MKVIWTAKSKQHVGERLAEMSAFGVRLTARDIEAVVSDKDSIVLKSRIKRTNVIKSGRVVSLAAFLARNAFVKGERIDDAHIVSATDSRLVVVVAPAGNGASVVVKTVLFNEAHAPASESERKYRQARKERGRQQDYFGGALKRTA